MGKWMNLLKKLCCGILAASMVMTPVYADGTEGVLVEPNQISVVEKDNTNGLLTVKIAYPSLADELSTVLVPVWTENNGQDDLIWYEAQLKQDGWYITVNAQNHKNESGIYNLHFYCKDGDGNYTILGGIKTELTVTQTVVKPQVSAVMNGNKVTLTLKNAADISGNPSVYFPVWGAANGQNDIVWYPGSQVSAGTWQAVVDLGNHNETGTYEVHVYAESAAGMTFVDATTFTVDNTISGKLTVEENNQEDGTFRLKISDVKAPGGVKQIYVPVWSEKDGQDDVIWYKAEKQGDAWYVDVDALNHKGDIGKYQAHVYIYDNMGGNALAAHTVVEVNRDTQLHISAVKNEVQSRITVTLKNYARTSADNTVYFAVWGNSNGQNDIVWYPAESAGKNTWKATINVADHGETGTYNIHVYELGSAAAFVTNTTCTIEGISSGTMVVDETGTNEDVITLRLTGIKAPSGISAVTVAVWTQRNNQDDLHWYEGVKSGDSWVVTVPKANHNGETGKYIAHAYAYDNNGFSKLAAFLDFNVSGVGTWSCDGVVLTSLNEVGGTFSVTAKNVKYNYAIQKVLVAVWSDWNGQDDLTWYEAEKNGNDWTISIDIKENHNGHRGLYNAHAYLCTYSDDMILLGGIKNFMEWKPALGSAGIDVSIWQSTIDWKQVKATGVDFAMIRSSYGFESEENSGKMDANFYYNITEAKKNNVKVGVYHYSYAETVEEAIAEANFCLSIVKSAGVALDYPIAFDIEETSRYSKDEIENNTNMIKAFCDTIEAAGYDAVVYGNPYLFNNFVDYEAIKDYGVWIARWTYDENKGYGDFENVQVWQYSNVGSLDGISGPVDLNVSFIK